MFFTTPLRTLPSASASSVCFFSRRSLFEGALREHDVAALLVDLDDAHAQFLPRRVSRFRTGRTSIWDPAETRTPISTQSPLMCSVDPVDDDLALGIGLLDFVPDLHLLAFSAREDDVAFTILGALEQHVDDVAGLNRHFAAVGTR